MKLAREREGFFNAYYPPLDISHLVDQEEGELKKRRVECSDPIAWKSFAEYSSCETGDNYLISAVANNETTTTTTAKSFCPRSDAIFSAVSSSPSLSRFPRGVERERKKKGRRRNSRCSDQLTLMSDIFGRLAKLAREPFHTVECLRATKNSIYLNASTSRSLLLHG